LGIVGIAPPYSVVQTRLCSVYSLSDFECEVAYKAACEVGIDNIVVVVANLHIVVGKGLGDIGHIAIVDVVEGDKYFQSEELIASAHMIFVQRINMDSGR